MLAGVCLWLVAAGLHVVYAEDPISDERLFKAAFIYNFAKFTRWPDQALENTQDSLILCTAGNDELIDDLKRLGGKMISGRPVSIRPLEKNLSPAGCHLLYIAKSEQQHFPNILASVRGKSVLTISELPGFSRSGGIIELYRKDAQTHFIINLNVARAAQLELSSRLLNLAVVMVIGQEETP